MRFRPEHRYVVTVGATIGEFAEQAVGRHARADQKEPFTLQRHHATCVLGRRSRA